MYRTKEELLKDGYIVANTYKSVYGEDIHTVEDTVMYLEGDNSITIEIVVFHKTKKRISQYTFKDERLSTYRGLANLLLSVAKGHYKITGNTKNALLELLEFQLDLLVENK